MNMLLVYSANSMKVTNHGVEPSLMDMMSATREFFRQPIGEKQRYTDLVDGERFEDHLEGYGSEQLTSEDQTSLDWSDRLHLKVEPQGERSLHLWPESLRSNNQSSQSCDHIIIFRIFCIKHS
jgi:isopenicillin N synthase-like dioxygenase